MKPSVILLLVSLLGNFVLGSIWFRRVIHTEATPVVVRPTPTTRVVIATHETAADPAAWKQLSAHGDKEFVAGLRVAGFPSRMIFRLAELRVKARYAEALKKFRRPADYAYWRGDQFREDLSPDDRIAQRRLTVQMVDELTTLLDGNSYVDSISGQTPGQFYSKLSPQKIGRLRAINKDYDDLANMVRARANGLMMQEDRDQLAVIEQEKRADLGKLLTPEELHEYDLRSSPSAQAVRNRLRYFDPTEDEFRAITDVQLAFDAAYGNGRDLNGEQQDRRVAAIAARDAQIKTLLSSERAIEYEIKTNSSYAMVDSLVSQFNPTADVTAAVGTELNLARRFNALRANHDLPTDARDAQLDMLSIEANNRMSAALGSEAFKQFKQNGGPINALLNRPVRKH
jgi:hypothetical protein